MKINCLEFIEKIRSEYDLTERANLAIIQVGNNEASNLYINSKLKEAEKWNVDTQVIKVGEDIKTDELCGYIYDLNHSKDVDGIILQLPLPKHIDEEKVINFIDEKKNVDGFKQFGLKSKYFEPCTPMGIMLLLDNLTNLDSKFVTLIGRGKTVGEPLRDMLLARNCTLCVCHSHTKRSDLRKVLLESDFVISAVGKPDLFNAFDLRSQGLKLRTVVIDAGISRINGKQVGDFSHEYLDFFDSLILYTPWVNGIGKLTVASLMMNVRKAKNL